MVSDPRTHQLLSAQTLLVIVSQWLLLMPQLSPEFQAFALLSVVAMANLTWGMCSHHCDTDAKAGQILCRQRGVS